MKKIIWMRAGNLSPASFRILAIMKLTLLLVFISIVQVTASVYSQATRLNLDLQDATIGDVFRAIEHQSEFDFFYNNEEIDTEKKVSVRYNDVQIEDILKDLCSYDPDITFTIIDTHIVLFKESTIGKYKIIDNQIVLIPAETDDNEPKIKQIQPTTVSGRLTSAKTGESIPGVNVLLKGTITGTVTDLEGHYSLELSSLTGILVFSYVGYESQQITINGRTEINVALVESFEKLDEVIVIGYGYQKKSDLTGSISSIKSDELLKVPVRNLDQALKGQAAGVFVVEPSGAPGSTASIRIRGINSITASNEPLFIVDGFQVSNISMINPNSIESMEVLKDASATAIYGSRGANGVILISTKRGEAGKTHINFDAYYGLQKLRKKIDMLNGTEYSTMVNEAIENSNLYLDPSQQYDILYDDPESFGKGTDWQDEIFRIAPVQNYQLSFLGGDEKTTYAVTGNVYEQNGILIGSRFSRMSFRTNLDRYVNNRLHLTSNMYFSRTHDDHVASSNVKSALIFAPILPVKDPDGQYHFINDVQNGALVVNPVSECKEKTDLTNTYYSLLNIAANYEIIEGLTLKVSLGGEIGSGKRNVYQPRTTYFGYRYDGIASITNSLSTQWQNENTLTYIKKFNENHRINILAGFTLQHWQNEAVTSVAQGFVNDNLTFYDLDSGSQEENDLSIPRSSASKHSLVSMLTRANYVLKEKYMFTFTLRRDGSSRFGRGNKWGYFPSGAFAWRMSEEEFIRHLDVFSNLKLRLSYGLTGNQEIGNYQSLALMSSNKTVFGNTINIGFSQIRLPNEELLWESTAQYNLGLDMGFWRNRLSLTADFYKKKTKDLLLEVKLPLTSGFGSAVKNVGSTENKGLELLVQSVNLNEIFYWATNFTFAYNKNKVVDIGDNDRLFPEGGEVAGNQQEVIITPEEPLGSFYGYIIDGIFQSEEEINNYPHEPGTKPGDYKFVDLNEDGIISDLDRKILGCGQPDFYGGITNNIIYKGFELSFMLYGVYGADILARYRYETESLAAGRQNNSTVVLNRWQPDNPDPNTIVPRATAEGRVIKINNYFIEDGSFFQLRSITLAYNFPMLTNRLKYLKGLRIYITGSNLLTLTNYSGYDPEVNVYGNNQVMYNIDYDPYPKSKGFITGVNVNF
jgi:TonB-linked SusC/RagA family outer membrane protein